jgi:hypothetical protein
MSIAESIARLKEAKESLKSAINAKGGNITTQRLNEYADVVLSITTKNDINMSFITASADDVLDGKVISDASGNKVVGNIQNSTITSDKNFVVISKGYVSEDKTITISEAAAPGRDQNVVHVYPGYVNSQIDITIPKTTLSVTDNVVSIDEGYCDADSVTIPEMSEPTINANVVTINKGYNKTQRTATIPEAKTPVVSGNKVTIYPGYIAQEQIIEVIVSEPDSSDKEYVYTVVDNTGSYPEIAGDYW